MEVSPQGKKQNLQTHARKSLSKGAHKDLWLVVREGSLADVDSALVLVKKSGGNINSRNIFGLTPLHIATWRNHIPIVRRLLAAGADPDARDGESGWSSLHRALHFGHLAVASILLQFGASITLEDSKYRTPIDLISGPVLQVLGSGRSSVATEVFSWGSGANYQLGTGNAHIQKLPCKVDALHGSLIKFVSAAKFHSVAVTAQGEVYTWGFGRGGRLGHPDFDIHSGQAAVITPRQVTSGLGSRRVKAVAAAKHHTVIATDGGEVFSWGSNRVTDQGILGQPPLDSDPRVERNIYVGVVLFSHLDIDSMVLDQGFLEGQLGYTSVDTQPTPRRVSSLRSKVVAVAAANKHTAVVSDTGEVFTWGGNREGQLGYGTSNSASNYTPRVVEYLKGKVFMGVAAAKYHTIVLGVDGEVYTWGHRLVTPKRVVVARNLKKSGNTTLKFHRKERLHVVSIAAGVVHSMALTDDGALFYWVSSDPDLRCHQLYSLCGRNVVNISAGKYWTAAVTATGDVYMWDGKNGKDKPPVATRLHGTKRATSVSVGETHLLIIGSLYHPAYPSNMVKDPQKTSIIRDELEEIDEDLMFNDMDSENPLPIIQDDASAKKAIPSLKSICEKVTAEKIVEPRNAIQLLEIADTLMADDLRKYCEDIAIRNLDYIFTVASQAIAGASPDILANLENLLDLKSSEPWSYRHLPTPTATFPAVIYSEEEDSECEVQRTRDSHTKQSTSKNEIQQRPDSFLQPKDDPNKGIGKEVRALRKKLQQIEMLEAKQSNGHLLDDQQIKKLETRLALESSLAELGVQIETPQLKASSSVLPDGKGNKKAELSRKQRRKNKQIATQLDIVSPLPGAEAEPNTIKGFMNIEISQTSKNKEEDSMSAEIMTSQATIESALCVPKENLNSRKDNSSSATVSKKKNKKGGLSMFLSGALDDFPKYIAPPPQTPKSEGPAWGGAKISMGFASLRDIQDEQIKIKEHQPTRNKDHSEDPVITKSDGKILLSSFLPSKPIPVGSVPVVPAPASLVSEGERSTPPWTASGTPPLLSRPSLRDIQMQQKGKQQQSLSHSPTTKTTGFPVTNGQGSPLDSSGLNRWFKPEVDAPSSIRSIQIEEKAMKDLRRFYSSVKVVKNPS